MPAQLFRLADASRPERKIIAAIRALHRGEPVRLGSDARRCLHVLVQLAGQFGYAIRASGTLLASDDELRLLGWLALFQRRRPDRLAGVDPRLEEALANAASAVGALGAQWALPYQAVLRAGFLNQAVAAKRPAGSGAQLSRAANSAPHRHSAGRSSPLRDKAVAHVRSAGRVPTADLYRIGLSHQYLSLLCRKGVLIRVRDGYYEAPG